MNVANLFGQTFKSEEDHLKFANQLFEDEKYSEAYNHYLQLLPSYRMDPDVNFRYGTCLLYVTEKKQEALPYLNFAASKNADPRVYFFLGKTYHLLYKFGVAQTNYKLFREKGTPADKEKYQVDLHIRMCDSGKKLLNNLTELAVEQKTETKTDNFPYSYDLSQMGGRIIISEEFQSKLDAKKGFRSMTYIPPLGTGNDVIFYASYGKDGSTGLDLYAKKRLPNGDWGEEQKLPDHINTPYDDAYGFLHSSKTTFYFCSKGHNSMGGYDIFKCSYDLTTNSFGPPVNMDYKINTPDDDIMYVVDSLEQNAYFASGRATKFGYLDVYKVRVETFPLVNVLLAGNFVNKILPEDNATIKIQDTRDDEIIGIYNPKQGGKYAIILPKSGTYNFIVETPNSEKIHQSQVVIPPQKEFKPLKQKIILTNESGTEQLIIQNLFDEEFSAEEMEALLADAMQMMADPEVNADQFENILSLDDKDSILGANQNFSFDDIQGMAKGFYEDAQEEADRIKDKMDAAFAVANKKSKDAAENAAAAEEILSGLNEIDNPLERQQQADLAEELNNKAKDEYLQATTAYNLANSLQSDHERAQNEANESKLTFESIQSTLNEKDHEKAIAQLSELRERIEEIINSNPKENAAQGILAQAKEKKDAANKSFAEAKDFRAEEEKLSLRLNNLKNDLEKAKEKDKAAIQVQIDEINDQIAINQKWGNEAYAKGEELDREAMALDHQAKLLLDLDDDLANASESLSEDEKAALEAWMGSNNVKSGIDDNESAINSLTGTNSNNENGGNTLANNGTSNNGTETNGSNETTENGGSTTGNENGGNTLANNGTSNNGNETNGSNETTENGGSTTGNENGGNTLANNGVSNNGSETNGSNETTENGGSTTGNENGGNTLANNGTSNNGNENNGSNETTENGGSTTGNENGGNTLANNGASNNGSETNGSNETTENGGSTTGNENGGNTLANNGTSNNGSETNGSNETTENGGSTIGNENGGNTLANNATSNNGNEANENNTGEVETSSLPFTAESLTNDAADIVDAQKIEAIRSNPGLSEAEKLEKENEVLQEWFNEYDYKIVEANKGLLETSDPDERQAFIEARQVFEEEQAGIEQKMAFNSAALDEELASEQSGPISEEYKQLLNETQAEIAEVDDFSGELTTPGSYLSEEAAEVMTEISDDQETLNIKEQELTQLKSDYDNESKDKKKEKIQTSIDDKNEEVNDLKESVGAKVNDADLIELNQNDAEIVDLLESVKLKDANAGNDVNYLKAKAFNDKAEEQRALAADKIDEAGKTTNADERSSLLEEAHALNSAAIDNQRDAIDLLEEMNEEDYAGNLIPVNEGDESIIAAVKNGTSNAGSETNGSNQSTENGGSTTGNENGGNTLVNNSTSNNGNETNGSNETTENGGSTTGNENGGNTLANNGTSNNGNETNGSNETTENGVSTTGNENGGNTLANNGTSNNGNETNGSNETTENGVSTTGNENGGNTLANNGTSNNGNETNGSNETTENGGSTTGNENGGNTLANNGTSNNGNETNGSNETTENGGSTTGNENGGNTLTNNGTSNGENNNTSSTVGNSNTAKTATVQNTVDAVNNGTNSITNVVKNIEESALTNVPDQKVNNEVYEPENDRPEAYVIANKVEEMSYSNAASDVEDESISEVLSNNQKVVDKIEELEDDKASLNIDAQYAQSDKEKEKIESKVSSIDKKIDKQESKLHEDMAQVTAAKVKSSQENLSAVKESFSLIGVEESGSTNGKQSIAYEQKAEQLVESAASKREAAASEKDKEKQSELLKEANSEELLASEYFEEAAELYEAAAIGVMKNQTNKNESALNSEEMAEKAKDLQNQSSILIQESIGHRDSALLAKGEEKVGMLQRAEAKETLGNTLGQIAKNYRVQAEDLAMKEMDQQEKESLLAGLSPEDVNEVKSLPEYEDHFNLGSEKNNALIQKAKLEGEKRGVENILLQQNQSLQQLKNEKDDASNQSEQNEIDEKIEALEEAIELNEDKVEELEANVEAINEKIASLEEEQETVIAALDEETRNDIEALALSDYNKAPVKKTSISFGDLISSSFEVPEKVESNLIAMDANIKYSDDNPIPLNPKYPKGLIYKVQVGAFSKPIPNDIFSGFAPITGEQVGNLVRYRVGYFVNYNTANDAKNEIRGMGYSDAFVVAIYNGEKITLAEARNLEVPGNTDLANNNAGNGVNTTNQANNSNNANNSNAASENTQANNAGSNNSNQQSGNNTTNNQTAGNNTQSNETNDVIVDLGNGAALTNNADKIKGLFYTVQLGAFSKPIQATDVYNISPLVTKFVGNLYKYSTGIYRSVNDAVARKNEVVALGNTDAFVTVYYNGEKISIAKAQELIDQYGESVFAADNAGGLKQLGSTSAAPVVNIEAKADGQYYIDLGTYSGEVPTDIANAMLLIPQYEVKALKEGNGEQYVVGYFSSEEDAKKVVELYQENGVENVEVKDKNATVELTGPTAYTGLVYRVFLGTYEGEVPASRAIAFVDLKDEGVVKETQDGKETYYAGKEDLYKDAQAKLKKFTSRGVNIAEVKAFLNGEEIDLEEAKKLTRE